MLGTDASQSLEIWDGTCNDEHGPFHGPFVVAGGEGAGSDDVNDSAVRPSNQANFARQSAEAGLLLSTATGNSLEARRTVFLKLLLSGDIAGTLSVRPFPSMYEGHFALGRHNPALGLTHFFSGL